MVVTRDTQLHLSGFPDPRVGKYWLFGDEIRPERKRLPVTGHGSLIVPADYLSAMYASLQLAREGFRGRVHFGPLKNGGDAVRTAVGWLDLFFGVHVEHVSFKGTFALHDGPFALPYPRQDGYERHAIHSTSSNAVGHIRYVLRGLSVAAIRPVFDHTDNAREREYSRLGLDTAQFRINERHHAGKRGYPAVFFAPLVFQSSDPKEAKNLDEAIKAEFLQFTDVLLGASAQAMDFLPTPGRFGRRRLARRVTAELASRLGRPEYELARWLRHFSLSLYPDERRRMYAPNPDTVPRHAVAQLQLGVTP